MLSMYGNRLNLMMLRLVSLGFLFVFSLSVLPTSNASAGLLPDGLLGCFDEQALPDQRISDCTTLVEADWTGWFSSLRAEAYFERGRVWDSKQDLDQAINDYGQAIHLNPDHAAAFNSRGAVWRDKGNADRAIKDHDEAIRLQPEYASAFYNRGIAWAHKGDVQRTIADYQQAIQLSPDYAVAHNNLAWTLATTSDPLYRDGSAAVKAAEKALSLSDGFYHRDTLAAAYAASGYFEDAVREQRAALAEADDGYRDALALRLGFYVRGEAIFCPNGPECD